MVACTWSPDNRGRLRPLVRRFAFVLKRPQAGRHDVSRRWPRSTPHSDRREGNQKTHIQGTRSRKLRGRRTSSAVTSPTGWWTVSDRSGRVRAAKDLHGPLGYRAARREVGGPPHARRQRESTGAPRQEAEISARATATAPQIRALKMTPWSRFKTPMSTLTNGVSQQWLTRCSHGHAHAEAHRLRTRAMFFLELSSRAHPCADPFVSTNSRRDFVGRWGVVLVSLNQVYGRGGSSSAGSKSSISASPPV